jgi:hypothetical protein
MTLPANRRCPGRQRQTSCQAAGRWRRSVLCLAALLSLMSPPAGAQSWRWHANGDWSDARNWQGGVPGSGAWVEVDFATVRIDQDANLGRMVAGFNGPAFITLAGGRSLTLGDQPDAPFSVDASYQSIGWLSLGDAQGGSTLRLVQQVIAPTLFGSDIRLAHADSRIEGQYSALWLQSQLSGQGQVRELHLVGDGWVRPQGGELRLDQVTFGTGYFGSGYWGVGLEVSAGNRAGVRGGDLFTDGALRGRVVLNPDGELRLDSAVQTLQGSLTLGTGARVLTHDGASALAGPLRVEGSLQLIDGTHVTLDLRDSGGTYRVQGASTALRASGASFADGVLRGTVVVEDGLFAYNGAPLQTNLGRIELRGGARFQAAGGVDALSTLSLNRGQMLLHGSTVQLGDFEQLGELRLEQGAQLVVGGVLGNLDAGGLFAGSLWLDGSTLSYAQGKGDGILPVGASRGPRSNGVDVSIYALQGELTLRNGARLLTQGSDALRTLNNVSGGSRLSLGGSQTLQLDGTLHNFGLLQLAQQAQLRSPGGLANSGQLQISEQASLALTGVLSNQGSVRFDAGGQDMALPGGVDNRGTLVLQARSATLGRFENRGRAELSVAGEGRFSELVNRGELSFLHGAWQADAGSLVSTAPGANPSLHIAPGASLHVPLGALLADFKVGVAGQPMVIEGRLSTPASDDPYMTLMGDLTLRGQFLMGEVNGLNHLPRVLGSLKAYGQQVQTRFMLENYGQIELREGSHWRSPELANDTIGSLLIDASSRFTLSNPRAGAGAGLSGQTQILGTLDLGGGAIGFNGGTHVVSGRVLARGEGSENGLNSLRYNFATLQLINQQVQGRGVTAFQPFLNQGRLELLQGSDFHSPAFRHTGSLFIDASSRASLGATSYAGWAPVENQGRLTLTPSGVAGHGFWFSSYLGGPQSELSVQPGTKLEIQSGLTQGGVLLGRSYELLGAVTVPEPFVVVAPGTRLVAGASVVVAGSGQPAALGLQSIQGEAVLSDLRRLHDIETPLDITGSLTLMRSDLTYTPLQRRPGNVRVSVPVVNRGQLALREGTVLKLVGLDNTGLVSVDASSRLDASIRWGPGLRLAEARPDQGRWQVAGALGLTGGRQSVLAGGASFEFIGAGSRVFTHEHLTNMRFEHAMFDEVLARVEGTLTLTGRTFAASATQGLVNTGNLLLREGGTLQSHGLQQQGSLQVLEGSVLDTRLGAPEGQEVVQDAAAARTRLDGVLRTPTLRLQAGELTGDGRLEGDLLMGDAARLALQVRSATDHDLFEVQGLLKAGGLLYIDIAAGLQPLDHSFGQPLQLLGWGEFGGSFAQIELGAPGWQTMMRADGLYLTAAVPEPATWLSLLLGLGWLAVRRAPGLKRARA